MSTYKPRMRGVRAHVLTALGWLEATFPLPERRGFVEHLDGSGAFLRLAAVRLPGAAEILPFFALQREAATLIVPTDREEKLEADAGVGKRVPRRIDCLLDHGVLSGTIDLLAGLRVSDFLARHSGFLVLENARLRSAGGAADETVVAQELPAVIVHAAKIVGVSETDDEDAPPAA